ncbi:MAG: hypothetical protein GWN64_17630 [Candidatus Thorarchaeota archaeon]|nr:hypothetical protein [Candidatus Thorarchaeota archaeon]
MEYNVVSTDGAWLLHFTYKHSTHSVNIALCIALEEGKPGVAVLVAILVGVLLMPMVCAKILF